uniref:Uncharacterized protein n=1 Tax=Amphimedon queenslandica TaxID=400682 RepID=A0A1X7TJL9_AMPQE
MPQIKCNTCGQLEGKSEWFKITQSIDKCKSCRKQDADAEKDKALELQQQQLASAERKFDKELDYKKWEFEQTKKKDEEKAKSDEERELKQAKAQLDMLERQQKTAELHYQAVKLKANAAEKLGMAELERVKELKVMENRRLETFQNMEGDKNIDKMEAILLPASLLMPHSAIFADSLAIDNDEHEENNDENVSENLEAETSTVNSS